MTKLYSPTITLTGKDFTVGEFIEPRLCLFSPSDRDLIIQLINQRTATEANHRIREIMTVELPPKVTQPCPGCGKTLTADLPLILSGYKGWASKQCDCGEPGTFFVVVPVTEEKQGFYERLKALIV